MLILGLVGPIAGLMMWRMARTPLVRRLGLALALASGTVLVLFMLMIFGIGGFFD